MLALPQCTGAFVVDSVFGCEQGVDEVRGVPILDDPVFLAGRSEESAAGLKVRTSAGRSLCRG